MSFAKNDERREWRHRLSQHQRAKVLNFVATDGA
jgi:hypothetical protein